MITTCTMALLKGTFALQKLKNSRDYKRDINAEKILPFVVLIDSYRVEKVFLNSSSEMSVGRSATQIEYSRSE